MSGKMSGKWWQEGVFYQIYPRSFMDSNGDGIGDLRGIISKLDYLQELGIAAVWLSPVYESPNDDNGYDISDYQAIMAEFGTLADWEELLAGLHARGIRLVMDLVVNHTSDEHAWFIESRKSTENPYRDYYIWRKGKPDTDHSGINHPGINHPEPNNWGSFFSGSAWKYDESTDAWFLHLFSARQPDLNWENPAVRNDIFSMMKWWVEKGVDGFRMDVINLISKTPGLPDGKIYNGARYGDGSPYYMNGPRLVEFLDEMKQKVLSQGDLVTIGETPGVNPEYASILTNTQSGPLDMVFQFEHMALDSDPAGSSKFDVVPWRLADLKQVTVRWQEGLAGKGWNSLYLSNHDQPRHLSRFGDDGVYWKQSAKLLATFLHTQQGTPFVYQGEELGMTNVPFASIEECRDVESLNYFHTQVAAGRDAESIMRSIRHKGRDNSRTPVQWDDSPNAGFSTGTPWLAVNSNYTTINAAQQMSDPESIFRYYQRLIALRKEEPVLIYGAFDLRLADHPQVFAYTRTLGESRLLVLLNFSGSEADASAVTGEIGALQGEVVLANYPHAKSVALDGLTLRPWEAIVVRIG